MTTPPNLIAAAREAASEYYPIPEERWLPLDQLVLAVNALPPDAVIVSAALLREAADAIASPDEPEEYYPALVLRLRQAADAGGRAVSAPVPRVLDVCCGSRMFWFDKADSRAVFIDKRRETYLQPNPTSAGGMRSIVIDPDLVADFTDLPFPDGRFSLVVFDPPHQARREGQGGWVAKTYGMLGADWRDEIRRGFSECFRVLSAGGTLVFKWNESEIPVAEILALTSVRPLFGNRCGKSARSHWIVFVKEAA